MRRKVSFRARITPALSLQQLFNMYPIGEIVPVRVFNCVQRVWIRITQWEVYFESEAECGVMIHGMLIDNMVNTEGA